VSERPHLVLVGGFLGAGKTTLILAAARELGRRGMRSAVILNDQGDALVDTELARAHGLQAGEVSGGCFCCRFSDLMDSAERLLAFSPDVIFAEPVGSCTDLNATTVLPIQSFYADRFRLAPLTVVVDPARAQALSQPDADPDKVFLFSKQVQEADLVLMAKSDLYPESAGERRVSARTGDGVAAWLDEVLSGRLAAAGRVLDIDYERYARAEAALVWLNLDLTLESAPPQSPAMVLGPLFDGIEATLTRAQIAIVHLKASATSNSGWVKAAACGNGRQPDAEGDLDASPALRHRILVNLRCGGDPDSVRAIVEAEVGKLAGHKEDLHLACFRPSAPKPEHRMTAAHLG
jgi:hypothetical protein